MLFELADNGWKCLDTIEIAVRRDGEIRRGSSVAGEGGFEPPNGGSKGRCLTAWRLPITMTRNRKRNRGLVIPRKPSPHLREELVQRGVEVVRLVEHQPVTGAGDFFGGEVGELRAEGGG